MKKRILPLLLALLLLLGLLPGAASAEELLANRTQNNGHPYYIMVNRDQNVVTVFGLDEAGYYTVPVRAMLCSTGVAWKRTPLGNFATSSLKKEWALMFDGNWGQYSTQFNGNMLFHSICYTRRDPAALMAFEYNDLGRLASSGCIRLQVIDAKWIYDNVEPGTVVTVYESDDPGPLGKPQKLVPEMTDELYNGWEPSDPRPENPWREKLVTALDVEEASLQLAAGERAALHWSVEKGSEVTDEPVWTSEDPAVATVDEKGSVLAVSAGQTRVTVSCGYLSRSVTVTVTGELLPFEDLTPGAWYYGDVRWAVENGVLRGLGDGRFCPEGSVSCAMVIQTLFNMKGAAEQTPEPPAGAAWYAKAQGWANRLGIIGGLLPGAAALERPVTRQEFALMLRRCDVAYGGSTRVEGANLSSFGDGNEVFAFAQEAMAWAVSRSILTGDENSRLLPGGTLTRAQLAAMLRRYMKA